MLFDSGRSALKVKFVFPSRHEREVLLLFGDLVDKRRVMRTYIHLHLVSDGCYSVEPNIFRRPAQCWPDVNRRVAIVGPSYRWKRTLASDNSWLVIC